MQLKASCARTLCCHYSIHLLLTSLALARRVEPSLARIGSAEDSDANWPIIWRKRNRGRPLYGYLSLFVAFLLKAVNWPAFE